MLYECDHAALEGIHREAGFGIKQFHRPELPVLPPASTVSRPARPPNFFERQLFAAKKLLGFRRCPADRVFIFCALPEWHVAGRSILAACERMTATAQDQLAQRAAQDATEDARHHVVTYSMLGEACEWTGGEIPPVDKCTVTQPFARSTWHVDQQEVDRIYWPRALFVYVPWRAVITDKLDAFIDTMRVSGVFSTADASRAAPSHVAVVFLIDTAGCGDNVAKEDLQAFVDRIRSHVAQGTLLAVARVDTGAGDKCAGLERALEFVFECMNRSRPVHEA